MACPIILQSKSISTLADYTSSRDISGDPYLRLHATLQASANQPSVICKATPPSSAYTSAKTNAKAKAYVDNRPIDADNRGVIYKVEASESFFNTRLRRQLKSSQSGGGAALIQLYARVSISPISSLTENTLLLGSLHPQFLSRRTRCYDCPA